MGHIIIHWIYVPYWCSHFPTILQKKIGSLFFDGQCFTDTDAAAGNICIT